MEGMQMKENTRRKTGQQKKIIFGIRGKILLIAFIPLFLLSVITAIFSASTLKTGMEEEAIKRLEDIVIGLEQALSVMGEGDFKLEEEILYKGEHNISADLTALKTFADYSNMDITICWGDTRVVTTLTDESTGKSMAGTKVANHVVQLVLQEGKMYTDMNIVINNEPYFCCYIPLKNPDGNMIGMIFAGEPSSGITDYIFNRMIQIILVNIVIIFLGSIFIFYFAWILSNSIRSAKEVIRQLAEGNLRVKIDEKLLNRKDELGSIAIALNNLVQQLSSIMMHMQHSSKELVNSGHSLDEMAERVNINASEIGKAVENISQGAISQAEEIGTASDKILEMGSMIENIVSDVDRLNTTSLSMKQAGDTSSEIMHHLVVSTDRTNEAIQKISLQIYATNDSAQKIREAVDIISSIANQTSLLSLNASIEAARAGEFGKGFAVVASEIQKLADESSHSAQTITDVINALLEKSDMSVKIMKQVEEIITDQREKLNATLNHFANVTTGINSSRKDTTTIEEQAKVCDSSRCTVVDVINNLFAFSRQNAASAQETTASMEELNTTINLLADAANSLRKISDQMEEEMKFFQL